MLKIKAFSQLVGLSVRSLRHYNQIGLLIPEHIDQHNGHRFYGERNFVTAQQILFYKELDFSLAEIKTLLNEHNSDSMDALRFQRNLLRLKRQRLDHLVTLLSKLISTNTPGDLTMNDQFKQALSTTAYDQKKAEYLAEAKQKWGHTPQFKQSQERMADYNEKDFATINEKQQQIYRQLAELMPKGIEDPEVQAVVHKARMLIHEHWYDCDIEAFQNLGKLYVTDQRFTATIDQHGSGLASFLSQAIDYYATCA